VPTIIQKSTVISWAKAITIRPLDADGTLPEPIPDAILIDDLSEIPVTYIVEQGERTIDKSDGVGIIAIHEEDDTLIGADLELNGDGIDLYILSLIVGGALITDGNGNIVSWTPPSITQQRDSPKRFELDIYVEAGDGYLRHRFFYCRGQQRAISYRMGLAGPTISTKARPNPSTELVHQMEYVSQLP
jgi:hypothetical protein